VESLILAEREAKGLFKTLDDFAERVNLRLLKRSVVKNLATVGSFDELARPIVPDTPREVVTHKEVIDRMMGVSSSIHAAASIGQLSMFGMMAAATPKVSRTSVLKPLPKIGKVDVKKRLDNEKELLGIYISEHPLQQIASEVGKKISHFCSDITEELVEQRVKIAGLLVGAPRVITTKKGKPMAFIKLEDLEGQIEVVVFPRTYEVAKDILLEDQIFLVEGKVNLRNDSLSVLADQIKLYQPGESSFNGSEPKVNGVNGTSPEPNHNGSTDKDSSSLQCHITLTMQRTDDHQEDLTRLERVILALQEHKGRDKLSLRCIIPNGNIVQMDFPKLTISWNAALKDIIDSQNILFDFKDITRSKKRKYRKKG
jgi:DNA polymerase-3 subunit alpha